MRRAALGQMPPAAFEILPNHAKREEEGQII